MRKAKDLSAPLPSCVGLGDYSTPKIEAKCSSETYVDLQRTTLCYIICVSLHDSKLRYIERGLVR
jgi:hypothetical protein